MKRYAGFRKVTITSMLLLCGAVFPSSIRADQTGISVTASGTVRYEPDIAEFTAAVSSTDKDAAKASAKVAGSWNALQQALRQAGIPATDASSAGYTVNPEWEWNASKGTRTFKGYTARHVVRVTVRDLRKVGAAVDAVVGAGAGDVENLHYSSSKFDSYRSEALESAVTSARKNADVMARAAGGHLGTLLELSYGEPQPVFPVMRAVAASVAAAPATEIQPGDQELSVSVSSRWQFLPGGGK